MVLPQLVYYELFLGSLANLPLVGYAIWHVEENAANRVFVRRFLIIFRAQLDDWNVLNVNVMAQGTMRYVSQLVRSIP
jgi:hypothetical protein